MSRSVVLRMSLISLLFLCLGITLGSYFSSFGSYKCETSSDSKPLTENLITTQSVQSVSTMTPVESPAQLSIDDQIAHLYDKHKEGVLNLHTWMAAWDALKKTSVVNLCHAKMCVEESELLYLRIRESRPESVIEVGPACGWSSLVILTALVHNKYGKLYSFDIEMKAPRVLDMSVDITRHIAGRWEFHHGPIQDTYAGVFAKVKKWYNLPPSPP